MSTIKLSTRIWVVASVTCILGPLLSAALATVALDALLHRPELGGSVTTRIPGFVYASATVMKVCLVCGVLSFVLALLSWVTARGDDGDLGADGCLPIWGIVSFAVTASTPLVGALVVILAQGPVDQAPGPSMSTLSNSSRTAVFVALAAISGGALSAVTSLVRRERPLLLPLLGLMANALLIALFWHFEFYARGFDQDTWAPR